MPVESQAQMYAACSCAVVSAQVSAQLVVLCRPLNFGKAANWKYDEKTSLQSTVDVQYSSWRESQCEAYYYGCTCLHGSVKKHKQESQLVCKIKVNGKNFFFLSEDYQNLK